MTGTNQPQHGYSRISEEEHPQEHDGSQENTIAGYQSSTITMDHATAKRLEWDFRWMSILFGANHGSVVSCLSLATSQFAGVGAWQSGILYMTYVASALFGATGVVKLLGGRNALVAGMALYCVYVLAFLLATIYIDHQELFAYVGAGVGGIGAGFLWTAQGAYFSMTATKHAQSLGQEMQQSTNTLSSIFAFYYLGEEVLLRALSSLSGSVPYVNWVVIFSVYFGVAVVSTLGLCFGVEKLDDEPDEQPVVGGIDSAPHQEATNWLSRCTSAVQLLMNNAKMKYMIGLNAVFGFSAAFLGSYVNGEVAPSVFPDSNMVGLLTGWLSIVAVVMSTVFERVANLYGKGSVLIIGSVCFAFVALPFLVHPNLSSSGWGNAVLLVFVYTMQGTGRATFEGALKAVFADFFPARDKEGAFANIILQNGTAGAIGYGLSFSLRCQHESRYCIRFRDGSLHDILTFELIVICSSIFAILGYIRALSLHVQESPSRKRPDRSSEDCLR